MSGDPLTTLLRAIAAGDEATTFDVLEASPGLARQAASVGASAQASTEFFLEQVAHHVYAGDTALHIAAAAYHRGTAERLVACGADPAARNRRGAGPLHYAADGSPAAPGGKAVAQEAMVGYLIAAGADANAADSNGATPLHRASRARCAGAVRALLAGGADPRRGNKAGSTALHLAVHNTGRGGTGAPEAKEQQKQIIVLLLQHGARPTDRNLQGVSVAESALAGWVSELMSSAK